MDTPPNQSGVFFTLALPIITTVKQIQCPIRTLLVSELTYKLQTCYSLQPEKYMERK